MSTPQDYETPTVSINKQDTPANYEQLRHQDVRAEYEQLRLQGKKKDESHLYHTLEPPQGMERAAHANHSEPFETESALYTLVSDNTNGTRVKSASLMTETSILQKLSLTPLNYYRYSDKATTGTNSTQIKQTGHKHRPLKIALLLSAVLVLVAVTAISIAALALAVMNSSSSSTCQCQTDIQDQLSELFRITNDNSNGFAAINSSIITQEENIKKTKGDVKTLTQALKQVSEATNQISTLTQNISNLVATVKNLNITLRQITQPQNCTTSTEATCTINSQLGQTQCRTSGVDYQRSNQLTIDFSCDSLNVLRRNSLNTTTIVIGNAIVCQCTIQLSTFLTTQVTCELSVTRCV